MAKPAQPDMSQGSADSAIGELASASEAPEVLPTMLDVHAPTDALHSWKGFFIHIATIVVGLVIAVGLEQSVEAINRHREVHTLREDLGQECRQILADARISEAAHLYELRWLTTRISQTQLAIRERHAIGPREPNDMPNYISPDIPNWRSAKSGGRTALLTKNEVNAYGEIEYVQAHVEEMETEKNTARYAVKSFNRRFPLQSNGVPDLSNASIEDLREYLGLLTTAHTSVEAYVHWLRIIIGAESAVAAGNYRLEDIYAAERKAGSGDSISSFM